MTGDPLYGRTSKILMKKRSEFPLLYDDAVMFLTATLVKNSVKFVISGSMVNMTIVNRYKFRNLNIGFGSLTTAFGTPRLKKKY